MQNRNGQPALGLLALWLLGLLLVRLSRLLFAGAFALRLIGRLRRQKLITCGDSTLAAIVGFRRGQALPLGAAGSRFLRECSGETLNVPDQGHHGQESDRNMNAAMRSHKIILSQG